MQAALGERRAELVALTQQSCDARVRHRAHVLVDAIDSPSLRDTAARLDVGVKTIGRWRDRFLAEGAVGLADRPRPGRPPLLPAVARDLLGAALQADPMAQGYPTATWTIADLTDLLGRHGWTVSTATVHRTVHALGYVHRRPRHDLHHRQDAEAVASARHVLSVLQKRGLISVAESACSTSMSASSTPIPTWQRAGRSAAHPAASPPRGPIAG